MMMMTSEWAFILDEADALSSMILSSEALYAIINKLIMLYIVIEY